MMEEQEYPEELVPKESYTLAMDFNAIMDDSCSLFVGRRMEGSPNELEEIDDNLYVMPDEVSENMVSKVPDMSMNILTTVSKIDYLKWQQTKNACEIWDGKIIDIKDFVGDVNFIPSSYAIIYDARNLHGIKIPYTKSFNSKKEYMEGKKYCDHVEELIDANFTKRTPYPFSAQSKLNHKPTNMNYWHVTLDIYEPGKERYTSNSKGYRGEICSYVVDNMLKKNIRIDIDEPVLDEKYYVSGNIVNTLR